MTKSVRLAIAFVVSFAATRVLAQEPASLNVEKRVYSKTENGWVFYRSVNGKLKEDGTFKEDWVHTLWYGENDPELKTLRAFDGQWLAINYEWERVKVAFAARYAWRPAGATWFFVAVRPKRGPTTAPTTGPAVEVLLESAGQGGLTVGQIAITAGAATTLDPKTAANVIKGLGDASSTLSVIDMLVQLSVAKAAAERVGYADKLLVEVDKLDNIGQIPKSTRDALEHLALTLATDGVSDMAKMVPAGSQIEKYARMKTDQWPRPADGTVLLVGPDLWIFDGRKWDRTRLGSAVPAR